MWIDRRGAAHIPDTGPPTPTRPLVLTLVWMSAVAPDPLLALQLFPRPHVGADAASHREPLAVLAARYASAAAPAPSSEAWTVALVWNRLAAAGWWVRHDASLSTGNPVRVGGT